MVKEKIPLRDIIIIALIVIVGIWALGWNADGPVEKAEREMERTGLTGHEGHNHPPDQGHDEEAPPPAEHNHAQALEPSDGEPLITMGAYVIGDAWFNQVIEMTVQQVMQAGVTDEEDARLIALEDMLLTSLQELIILKVIEENDVQPDEDYYQSAFDDFYESFATEQEAVDFLGNMGMTIAQLEKMFEDEAVMQSVYIMVADELGLDVDADDFPTQFGGWMTEKVNTADFVFANETHRELYDTSVENGWPRSEG